MANEEKMETVAGAIQEFGERGFDRNLKVTGGRLQVVGTDRMYRPDQVLIREHRRFEGVSDPGDTSVVYAIETSDGVRGTLVDAYNAYADPSVGEFLRNAPAAAPSGEQPRPTLPPYEKTRDLPGSR
jgi:hypothetical protein